MPDEIHHSTRRAGRFFRIAICAVGFGFIFHLTQIECAKSMGKMEFPGEVHRFAPKAPEAFQATAYCVTGITKSGVPVAPGHVAADPRVIPLGSMIYVDSPLMGGIYQVLDTGRLIKGKIIDIYIPNYERCIEFGRRMVKIKVLRYGYLGYPPNGQREGQAAPQLSQILPTRNP
jgi:3D (Asp-Asp-Asp) domain-containing protein